jgi:hypothetical protein
MRFLWLCVIADADVSMNERISMYMCVFLVFSLASFFGSWLSEGLIGTQLFACRAAFPSARKLCGIFQMKARSNRVAIMKVFYMKTWRSTASGEWVPDVHYIKIHLHNFHTSDYFHSAISRKFDPKPSPCCSIAALVMVCRSCIVFGCSGVRVKGSCWDGDSARTKGLENIVTSMLTFSIEWVSVLTSQSLMFIT